MAASGIEIRPEGDQPAKLAPEAWFTGRVWQEPVVTAPAPARLTALRVTFSPGARTNWHTHPLGQTLYILSGVGRIAARGGAVREMPPGASVWIPPGEEHWHGAGPNGPMIHLAMAEAEDGRIVEWLEPVEDADYAMAPT